MTEKRELTEADRLKMDKAYEIMDRQTKLLRELLELLESLELADDAPPDNAIQKKIDETKGRLRFWENSKEAFKKAMEELF